MAGEGVQNMIARRVTDDLIVFSGKTSPSRYTKFLLEQKIAESHRFVERIRSEVATSRDCIAQLNAGRLDGLNEVIDDDLEEIEKLETNVKILKGAADVV
nr:hypothetical protein [Tanacetum cinerariifolium]